MSFGLVNIPLAKLSYTPDLPTEVQQWSWSHHTNDIAITLDNFRGSAGTDGTPLNMLKVSNRGLIMMDIPVEKLINQAKSIIDTMSQLKIELRTDQLPISALAKSPLFGIRYNVSDNMVRRVQFKFTSAQDYDTVVSHLRNLGLSISANNARKASIKPTSSGSDRIPDVSEPRGLSYPASSFEADLNRPDTALSSNSFFAAGKASNASDVAPHPALLRLQNAFAGQNLQPSDHIQRPTSGYSDLVNRERNPQSTFRAPGPSPLDPPEYFPRPASSSSLPSILEHRVVHTPESNVAPEMQTSLPQLPPIRELPFPRQSPPKSASGDTVQVSSRRSSCRSSSALQPSLPPSSSTIDHSPGYHPRDVTSAPSHRLPLANPTQNTPSSPTAPSHPNHHTPSSSDTDAAIHRIMADISTIHASSPSPHNLAPYAAQSPEDRRTILNDFFLQLIDNEDFLRLTEDVEIAWARLGLGVGLG